MRAEAPSASRTRLSPTMQYLIAAAGSLPGEPKFPWPWTKGYLNDQGWASRTKVS